MLSFSEFQEKARTMFGSEEYNIASLDPISFLYSLEWHTPTGDAYSGEVVAKMNMDFDVTGCFGRALKAAVLVEKYFPKETFFSAEVCEDLFREILLTDVTSENWNDITYVEEILQYEDPHIILTWNEKQFDASFKLISVTPSQCAHPKVKKHDLWKGLYVTYAMSEASIVYRGLHENFLKVLNEIEGFYPDMILLKENKCSPLTGLDRDDEVVVLMKEILKERKDARILFSLWCLSGDDLYKTRLIEEYSEEMFRFLTQKFFL